LKTTSVLLGQERGRGLFSDPVTSKKQLVLSAIPQRKGKHPAQVLQALVAVLFVKVNDRLYVAP